MRGTEKRVLVADDEEGIRLGLERLLRREGYEPALAATAVEALDLAEGAEFAAAIVDLRLDEADHSGGAGQERGTWLLERLRARDGELAVIMMTGYGSVESAVRSMKEGAADYILKPIDNDHLLEALRRALELRRLRRDNAFLKRELLATLPAHDLVTKDPRYLALIDLADRVKDSVATVLLTGESGTGKEVMARYLHFTSSRRDRPFVGINCAALSESLLLSELFGHEKGSFTGAVERRLGKFELADHGTLFLDEIGDMAPAVQSKLLRVLEESSFERVGGTRRVTVDIRVIAATNKDLPELIRRGEFRSDLYYRINIVTLRLPPLRERRDDIPLLVDYLVAKGAKKYNRNISGVAPEVVELWGAHDWPGNVRELQNAVNQAVLLCRGSCIDLATVLGGQVHPVPGAASPCLSPDKVAVLDGAESETRPGDAIQQPAGGSAAWSGGGPAPGLVASLIGLDPAEFSGLKDYRDAVVARCERAMIEAVLRREGGNKTRTAAALGITRKTLAEKLAEYGLSSPRCEEEGAGGKFSSPPS